eukprot:496665-Pelagomonas_calceolata.AAC.1
MGGQGGEQLASTSKGARPRRVSMHQRKRMAVRRARKGTVAAAAAAAASAEDGSESQDGGGCSDEGVGVRTGMAAVMKSTRGGWQLRVGSED